MDDLVKQARDAAELAVVAGNGRVELRADFVRKLADRIEALERGEQMAEIHMQDAVQFARIEALEEVASPDFLRPLIEEQSEGEWDDKTIDKDVAMFAAAIRALKEE